MRTRESIQIFLHSRELDSPHLIPAWSPSLETQVMTRQDGETTDIPGEFTEDGERWANKRWPYNAGTNPNYSDPQITFSPANAVTLVGTTWWDWERKKSVAVGIDIDHKEGHAASTAANDDNQLAKVLDRLKLLDYVTVVRSKGGKGVHVYVFFDPASQPDAGNHHEHAIVARKTLALISGEIGYDLAPHVDCVGSVFWIWAKDKAVEGFSLIKQGGFLDGNKLAAIELPVATYRSGGEQGFDSIQLNEEHRRVLSAISEEPFYFNLRSDLGIAHCHTLAIAAAANSLGLPGGFQTASEGTDPSTANCYLVPQADGSFKVCRFGQSQQEPDWEWDGKRNYTTLNVRLPYHRMVQVGGSRKAKGKYEIGSQLAREVAAELGESLPDTLPKYLTAKLGDNSVQFESTEHVEGWEIVDSKWRKAVYDNGTPDTTSWVTSVADDELRYVADGENTIGWYMNCSGTWLFMRNSIDVSSRISKLFGEGGEQAREILINRHWTLTSEPFTPELPGDRRWNYSAPQLSCEPTRSGGDHPYFDTILEHIGGSLDMRVQESDWCRRAGLHSGADYMRAWLACLIHHPDQPLPYLFLVGPQNSGKSILHEAAKLLFTRGVVSANSAISSPHNAELRGALMVYIEERDLADKRIKAYERIKELSTCREILIHEKFKTPVLTQSYLHFVQMANSTAHLPLEDGDSRVVVLDVPALPPGKEIPKVVLERGLRSETPRFLRTLLNMSFPPPESRLRIPALTTATKEAMEETNSTTPAKFMKHCVFPAPGHKVEFDEAYTAYTTFCRSVISETPEPVSFFSTELALRSDRVTLGRRKGVVYLVNASLEPVTDTQKKMIIVNSSGAF